MPLPEPPALGYGAYDPPAAPRGRPAVILWFRTYAAIAALLSGALVALVVTQEIRAGGHSLPLHVYILGGYALAHAVGVAVPHKPWAWTYALALICLGLLSITLPVAIALLLYWKEPVTKAAFRRFL